VILAIGHDVVDVPGFRAQLAEPGSTFADRVFTARERATAKSRPSDAAVHLAARWAAKEALVKAWSSARHGLPPVHPHADWAEIELVSDRWRRPKLVLHGEVKEHVETLGVRRVHVSLSHDGDIASAVVMLEG
jgi:holo-[acyl-carrier protein] synthase